MMRMALKEKLTEKEAWLAFILSDPGLSAEFFWVDEDGEPFRLWDYQWGLFDSEHRKEIVISARKVAKTETITARAMSFPFREPKKTLFITAAQHVHLETLLTRLDLRIENSWIHRMFTTSKTTKPYKRVFFNGTTVFGRVPQKTGVGVKSLHAQEVYADEYQDFTDKAKKELAEVFQAKGRRFLCGVPDIGADAHIKRLLESGYRVVRIARMFRPDWGPDLKKEKVEEYGSEESFDYRRNLYGETVEEVNALFPRKDLFNILNSNRDDVQNVMYQSVESKYETGFLLRDSIYRDDQGYYDAFYFGIDVGWSVSPTAIVIFGEKDGKFHIVKVLKLYRYPHPELRAVITQLVNEFVPQFIAIDATAGGVGFYQELARYHSNVIGIDFRKMEDVGDRKVYVNDLSIEILSDLIMKRNLILPYDIDLINEWSSAAANRTRDGRLVYSKGLHTLDAARVFSAGLFYSKTSKDWTFSRKLVTYSFPIAK